MHPRVSVFSTLNTQQHSSIVPCLWRGLLRYHPHRHDPVVDVVVTQHRTLRTIRSRRCTTIVSISSNNNNRESSFQIPFLYRCKPPVGVFCTERLALTTHRWLSDIPLDDSDVSNEEETSKLTVEMKKDLAILEKRFLRLELEPHGRHRGIEVARQMIEEEKLEKRVTKGVANVYLNNWIYRLYSLRLGYDKITDIPGEILAHHLIRDGTTIRFWKYKNPKTILKEMYRYPTRPTAMQQRYIDKDQKEERKDTTVAATATTNSMTPEEEEREKRMWDPNLLRPKPYGTKKHRDAELRKRQRQAKKAMT